MDLSILCITKVESFAQQFIAHMVELARTLDSEMVIAADGETAANRAEQYFPYARTIQVSSQGYLESVHDLAVAACRGKFVLRLDDDEKCSSAMLTWLWDRKYREHDHWKFARAAMWTPTTFLKSPQLWPDHQTRLSAKSKSMGRNTLHAGSPHGGGWCAPVAIEHYKFVVKSLEERRRIAENYDRIWKGSGTNGMLAFSLPELVYGEDLPIEPWYDGMVEYV